MEEEIVMIPEDESNATEKFVWSRAMVLALIEAYKKLEHEFKESNVKKKHVWRKISEYLAGKGYPNVTEDMCDKKWRNLKKTFKEIYIGQRGSPLRTRWGFYSEVEEIFSKDPNIVNAASVSVSTKPCLTTKKIPGRDGQEMRFEVMEVVGNVDEEYLEEGEAATAAGTTGSSEEYVHETSDMSVQQPPTWFTEFLQQYHNDETRRTEMLNKMHADIVALEERKCALLATLIEKLGSSAEVDTDERCRYTYILEPQDNEEGIFAEN